MNKIYKVIWSKAKNCYVVASELAKSHTKSPKSVVNKHIAAGILACIFGFEVVIPVSVYAAAADTVTSAAANTTKLFLLGHTAAGTAQAKYDSGIYATTTSGQLHVGSLQSGGAITGTTITLSSATPAVITKNTGLTRGTAPSSTNSKWIIESLDSAGKVTGGLYKSVTTANKSGVYMYDYPNKDDSSGGHYIAVGHNADGSVYTYAPTPGTTSNDTNIATTAFVNNYLAQNKLGLSGGSATGLNTFAVGNSTAASGDNSIAIGSGAQSIETDAIAIGIDSVSACSYSSAIGACAKSYQLGGIALGWGAQVGSDGNGISDSGSIAIGTSATVGKNIGKAIAIGSGACVNSYYSMAIGNNSSASAGSALAIGREASATADFSVAIGPNSVSNESSTISFGNSTTKRRLVNVADGINDTDVATVGQLNTAIAGITDNNSVTHLYAGSGTAANATTTSGSTMLTIADDTTVRDSITIKGSGYTTVTSNAEGVITINSWMGNVLGSNNTATCYGTTVTGGTNNETSGPYASVTGGCYNVASGCLSTVTGGSYNKANGEGSAINGGCANIACGCYSYITGGSCNSVAISGCYSSIFGGSRNSSEARYTSIVGGSVNKTSGNGASIVGGSCNIASGGTSSIVGGCQNVAGGGYSLISGGMLNRTGTYYSYFDDNNVLQLVSPLDSRITMPTCSYYSPTITVSVPIYDSSTGEQTGSEDKSYTLSNINGDLSSVFGGKSNASAGNYSTVSGGLSNVAVGDYSLISGGQFNQSIGEGSSVFGGSCNIANGKGATVIGGYCNTAVPLVKYAYTTSSGSQGFLDSNVVNRAVANSTSITFAGRTYDFQGYAYGDNDEIIGYKFVSGYYYSATLIPSTRQGSVVVGGVCNLSTGEASLAVGGCSGQAYADYSSVIGGGIAGNVSCATTALGSVAIGKCATTTRDYEVAIGSACAPVTIGGNLTVTGTQTVTDGTTTKTWSTILSGGSVFTGATSNAAGVAGLVKAPSAGDQTKFLRGDGTWAADNDTTYSAMTASEATTGTATTARSITAKVLADYVGGKITDAKNSTITGLSVNGTTITYTKGDGTTGTITTQDNNTTYSAATSSVLGLVKTGSNITNNSGTISLTKDNVTAALGYTPPTTDTNTTYDSMSASELTTGTATTARSISAKVVSDFVKGKTDDKLTSLSVSGKTITFTKGDGTTGTITTQDTTYDAGTADLLTAGIDTTNKVWTSKVIGDYVTDKVGTESTARSDADTALSNRIGTIASDGNYIKSASNISANLQFLDAQIKNNTNTLTSQNTNITALDNNVIKYDTSVADKARATLGGTQGTVLANLKSGAVTQTSMEAVNGSQLYAVKQDITGFASDIQSNATNIDALNSSVTSMLSSVSASSLLVDSLDSQKADKSLSNLNDAGKRVLKSYAEDAVATYLAEQGLSVPAAPMAVNTTNSNTLTVTNAGNGSLHVGEGSYVNGTSSIAIGVGNQVNANNSGAFGDPSIINADESYVLGNDDTINTGATGSFIVGNDGVSDAKGGLLFGSNTKATAEAENGMALGNRAEVSAKNAIALGSGSIADIENTLSIGNTDLKRKIVNVADGDISQNSNEAVTGAQLFLTNEKVQQNTDAIAKKADIDAGNINTSDWATKLGIGKVEADNTDLVTGGTVYDAIQGIKGNDLVQSNDDAITIGANSTASVIDVSNANGQGRVITGVITDVNDATSVANVGYVNQVGENIINATNSALQRVDNKINKAGANAAAIANLPTPTFDGEEKWAFAVGVGRYQGETAGAVGAFYKPTDNVIARVSGSFGNGDEMVGAGVAVSLNKGNTPAVSKAQLVRTINAQADKINTMEATHKIEMDNMKALREADRAEIAELKAMVADLAAKVN